MSADERPGLVGLVQSLQLGYGTGRARTVAREVLVDMDEVFAAHGPTPFVERLSEAHMNLLAGMEAGR